MRRHLIIAAAVFAAVLASPFAQAQEQAALSLGAGLVDPVDVPSTFWITANYRFRIADRLLLEPEVGYWKKGDEILDGVDVSVEDLDFGVTRSMPWPTAAPAWSRGSARAWVSTSSRESSTSMRMAWTTAPRAPTPSSGSTCSAARTS